MAKKAARWNRKREWDKTPLGAFLYAKGFKTLAQLHEATGKAASGIQQALLGAREGRGPSMNLCRDFARITKEPLSVIVALAEEKQNAA